MRNGSRQLVLIRHAESKADFALPASSWGLTERGREQAQALAGRPFWRGVRSLASSDEPKALATALPAAGRYGLPLVEEPGLREVERPAGRLDDFEARVRAYLEDGRSPQGWEPRAAAAARFREAVGRLLDQRPEGRLALVSHGTVLALFLAEVLGAGAWQLWQAIPFAGHARLDLDRRRLIEPFRRPGLSSLLAASRRSGTSGRRGAADPP